MNSQVDVIEKSIDKESIPIVQTWNLSKIYRTGFWLNKKISSDGICIKNNLFGNKLFDTCALYPESESKYIPTDSKKLKQISKQIPKPMTKSIIPPEIKSKISKQIILINAFSASVAENITYIIYSIIRI